MRTALASFLAFALSAALAATRALPRVEGHGQARSAGGHPAVRLQPDGDRAESRSHRKGLWLAAGETLVVRVQQEGTDVSLRLLGPGQEELARADSPTAGWGREELWWTAASPGLYSLEIQSDEPAPWRYRPDVERHTARAEDRLRAQAFGLYLEAEKRRRGEAPGPPGPLYQEAAARFREAGEGRAAGL
ncbi:MAG TPA: hypothetical protein PK413_16860, partial [Thermoanaerobaculia bacterium]|nr:hypothetical protein [Thermoanaerobaculia bacterium]